METLEDRTLPAAVFWTNLAGGDWAVPGNWSTGALPGPSDDVYLPDNFISPVSGRITITHTTGNDAIASLHNYGSGAGPDDSLARSELVLSGGSLAVGSSLFSGRSEITSYLTINGGTLAGPGDLTVDSGLTWTSGAMSGGGRTVAGGGLLISGAAAKGLDGRELDNAAGATWTSTGALALVNGAALDNLAGATFTVQSQATLWQLAASSAPAFTNAGTVTIARGGRFSLAGGYLQTAGSTTLDGGSFTASTFTNAGTVTIGNGRSLTVSAYTQTDGATNLAGGSLAVLLPYAVSPSAGASVISASPLPQPLLGPLNLLGGSLTGWGNIQAHVQNAGLVSPAGPGLTVPNVLTVSGSFDNTGTVDIGFGNTLAVYSYSPYWDPRLLTASSTAAIIIPIEIGGYTQTAGSTTLDGGTLSVSFARLFLPVDASTSQPALFYPIIAQGSVDIQGGSLSGFGSIVAYVVNNGQVSVGSAAAETLTINGAFSNTGSVTIGPGTLKILYFSYIQTAGTTVLGGGHLKVVPYSAGVVSSSALFVPLGGFVDIEGGVLTGSGTIDGDLINGGQVDVGGAGAAGLLTVTGNYTQTPSGMLNVELGGYGPGTEYDQLQIGGVARLAGTVNVTLLADFVPAAGDFFQVITFNSAQAGALTVNGPDVEGLVFVYAVLDHSLDVGFLPAL
jgi:hypothetical protein